jgi:hypothetical protein
MTTAYAIMHCIIVEDQHDAANKLGRWGFQGLKSLKFSSICIVKSLTGILDHVNLQMIWTSKFGSPKKTITRHF